MVGGGGSPDWVDLHCIRTPATVPTIVERAANLISFSAIYFEHKSWTYQPRGIFQKARKEKLFRKWYQLVALPVSGRPSDGRKMDRAVLYKAI